jgi:phosphoglucosamine mutase
MLQADKPLSEMAKLMDIYPQELINIDVQSKPDLQTVPQIVEVIKQVEAELKDEGRVLVRYSGTQKMCRVMVEGPTEQSTKAYAMQIAEVVRTTIG